VLVSRLSSPILKSSSSWRSGGQGFDEVLHRLVAVAISVVHRLHGVTLEADSCRPGDPLVGTVERLERCLTMSRRRITRLNTPTRSRRVAHLRRAPSSVIF
jgi:hypothetical protein